MQQKVSRDSIARLPSLSRVDSVEKVVLGGGLLRLGDVAREKRNRLCTVGTVVGTPGRREDEARRGEGERTREYGRGVRQTLRVVDCCC